MKLKQFVEKSVKSDPLGILLKYGGVLEKLLELEAIENYLITMLGIELDINVKKVKRVEGRFYGKVMVKKLEIAQNKTGGNIRIL